MFMCDHTVVFMCDHTIVFSVDKHMRGANTPRVHDHRFAIGLNEYLLIMDSEKPPDCSFVGNVVNDEKKECLRMRAGTGPGGREAVVSGAASSAAGLQAAGPSGRGQGVHLVEGTMPVEAGKENTPPREPSNLQGSPTDGPQAPPPPRGDDFFNFGKYADGSQKDGSLTKLKVGVAEYEHRYRGMEDVYPAVFSPQPPVVYVPPQTPPAGSRTGEYYYSVAAAGPSAPYWQQLHANRSYPPHDLATQKPLYPKDLGRQIVDYGGSPSL